MGRFNLALLMLVLPMFFALVSCEERSNGFLDDGQQGRIGMLTDAEWVMSSIKYPDFDETVFDGATTAYKFERNGKGCHYGTSFADPGLKTDVSYYRWTFTNDNFAVIQMQGTAVDGYWLIEKLTASELWVTACMQDPVLYPNAYKYRCKFVARRP